ncbi:MAG: cupin domain-containing protein [Frankiales bacterium]|nr:MAG: cupin domain-containing protein [Frankiales bacterium]
MSVLAEVGPRLRRARGERTLREVAEQTGISTSTLSRLESGLRKPTLELLLPPLPATPELRSHEGYEWLYVLDGRLRLLLGDQDLELGPGEAAEFDTHVPHALGAASRRSVELLGLFGPQGERMHVTAAPRSRR